MKKIFAIFSLILLLLIQFGSVGFTVYNNKCKKANLSSYSIKKTGCLCSKTVSNKLDKTKNCCKKKKKTCCSKNDNTQTKAILSKKCCTSNLMTFKLLCETFNNDLTNNLNFDNQNLVELNNNLLYTKNVFSFPKKLKTNIVKCNSPPLISVNKRIFIQSFQI